MTEILGLLPVHTFQRGKFYSRLKIYTGNSSQNNGKKITTFVKKITTFENEDLCFLNLIYSLL